MSERPIVVTVCYSRCLYCGRCTPHEVCHEHSEALHPGWWDRLGESADPDALWRSGYGKPDETCDDGACPLWEPGEWDARQRRAAMTPEERMAKVQQINVEIAARREARS